MRIEQTLVHRTPEPSPEHHEKTHPFEIRIQRAMKEGRARVVGAGSTGDVRIITERDTRTDLPWVIKTRTQEPPSHRSQRTTLKTEWVMHQRAHRVLATQDEMGGKIARVPQPIAMINTVDSQRMIMEYISGETLFERALRFMLLRYAEDDEAREIQLMRREELVDLATSDAFITLFSEETQQSARWTRSQPSQTLPALTEEHLEEIIEIRGKRHNGQAILTRQQYHQLNKSMSILHAHNIGHGDLHASNIIIEPTGNVVIIDFGLSKAVSSPTSACCRDDQEYLAQYKKIAV